MPLVGTRRSVLGATAAAAAGLAAVPAPAAPAVRRRGIPLGYDTFAVRAMQWNARQLIDHAVELDCDSVFMTDFAPFASRYDDAFLGALRRHAAERRHQLDELARSIRHCRDVLGLGLRG